MTAGNKMGVDRTAHPCNHSSWGAKTLSVRPDWPCSWHLSQTNNKSNYKDKIRQCCFYIKISFHLYFCSLRMLPLSSTASSMKCASRYPFYLGTEAHARDLSTQETKAPRGHEFDIHGKQNKLIIMMIIITWVILFKYIFCLKWCKTGSEKWPRG